jgi:hypothetical protein
MAQSSYLGDILVGLLLSYMLVLLESNLQASFLDTIYLEAFGLFLFV